MFRYYWVLVKLLIAPFATVVQLVHIQPIELLARAAERARIFGAGLHQVQVLMLVASSAALAALVVLTTVSVFKPPGPTRYGWRKLHEQRALSQP